MGKKVKIVKKAELKGKKKSFLQTASLLKRNCCKKLKGIY